MYAPVQQATTTFVDEAEPTFKKDLDLDLAYFTNSYPQDSDTVKCLISSIKLVTFLAIMAEVFTSGKLISGLIQYG